MSLASGAPAAHAQNPAATLPSIRFTAYVDPRAQRPSLTFSHTTRILPSGFEVIRVGRYSERDGHGTVSNTGSDRTPNASPVGFKSKVVSRRHCEFWFENSKWYIKDVKSSSGTFLNHIRLSPPGTESKPYVVNDGDIVQLGIDFKGGEEMIFRCVKIRLELNRGWASRPSNFNLASHKRLRSLVSQGSSNSQDCSICLNSIAPCQSLFVAPCSHTWHYKCIRSLLNTPQYPYFQCPNCRASADLEAEVEEPDEDWERLSDVQEASADSDSEGKGKETVLPSIGLGTGMGVGTTGTVINQSDDVNSAHSDPLSPSLQTSADAPARTSTQMLTDPDAASSSRAQPSSTSSADSQSPSEWSRSAPVPIASSNGNTANSGAASSSETTPSAMGFHRPGQRTPSPSNNPAVHGADGPITPRNDAGPWVFDGSAGRRAMAALGVGVGVAMPAFAPGGRAAEANPGSIDGIMDTDDDER
jgi:pSer/pThr/pTyr-binding forkhead associated (FHA) protein